MFRCCFEYAAKSMSVSSRLVASWSQMKSGQCLMTAIAPSRRSWRPRSSAAAMIASASST
jgi:hypothetical protein